jgi:hypothetical protein
MSLSRNRIRGKTTTLCDSKRVVIGTMMLKKNLTGEVYSFYILGSGKSALWSSILPVWMTEILCN